MSGFEPIMAAFGGKAAFASAMTGLATSVIGGVASNAQAKSQASYQQALQAQQQAQAQAQAQAQLAGLQASYDNEADRRRRQLKVELASRKAAFGASGLETASSGSANAVLKGLVTQSASEQEQDDKMYKLKADAIGQNLSFANQRNLLEQSRQFSGSSSGLGLAGNLLKSML
ncbi:MAG: hypothetical protein HQL44_12205 [Alphaproteobacteria bacterium]|nr:hypothetical protein [Alphaproteobacteria bacterium]